MRKLRTTPTRSNHYVTSLLAEATKITLGISQPWRSESDIKKIKALVNSICRKRGINVSPKPTQKKTVNPFRNRYCGSCKSLHRGICRRETKRCNNCGIKGHSIHECKAELLCYTCIGFGHISQNCPKMETINDQRKENSKIEVNKASKQELSNSCVTE